MLRSLQLIVRPLPPPRDIRIFQIPLSIPNSPPLDVFEPLRSPPFGPIRPFSFPLANFLQEGLLSPFLCLLLSFFEVRSLSLSRQFLVAPDLATRSSPHRFPLQPLTCPRGCGLCSLFLVFFSPCQGSFFKVPSSRTLVLN